MTHYYVLVNKSEADSAEDALQQAGGQVTKTLPLYANDSENPPYNGSGLLWEVKVEKTLEDRVLGALAPYLLGISTFTQWAVLNHTEEGLKIQSIDGLMLRAKKAQVQQNELRAQTEMAEANSHPLGGGGNATVKEAVGSEEHLHANPYVEEPLGSGWAQQLFHTLDAGTLHSDLLVGALIGVPALVGIGFWWARR